jgi:hypothetical protein
VILLLNSNQLKPTQLIAMAITKVNHPGSTGDWQEVVLQQVGSLNFGTIEIVIHDSRIVQIDTTERFRFPHGGLAKSIQPESSNGTIVTPSNRR